MITTVKTKVPHLCFQAQQYLKPLCDKQKKRSLPYCSPCLPSTTSSSLLLLSESWFHLTWQSCGSHGRRCYKCSVTTLNMAGSERPRQLSDATWGNRQRCSASLPPVRLQPLSLISTTLANCSVPTLFSWPSFDTGEGECAGGEVVAGNKEGGKESAGCRRGKFLVQMMRGKK